MKTTKKMTREQLEQRVQQLEQENKQLQVATKRYQCIVKRNTVRPRYRNTSADIMSSVVYLERLIKDLS